MNMYKKLDFVYMTDFSCIRKALFVYMTSLTCTRNRLFLCMTYLTYTRKALFLCRFYKLQILNQKLRFGYNYEAVIASERAFSRARQSILREFMHV